jgi:hypothetical protein
LSFSPFGHALRKDCQYPQRGSGFGRGACWLEGGEGMFDIRKPTGEEIADVLEAICKERELEDDREIWIWSNFLD